MFRLRRRSVAARTGIIAAVIGMFVLTALLGASATLSSASPPPSASTLALTSPSAASATTALAEGDTKCVPWGKGGLGLKCTGTYGGKTAYDPWTGQNLPASDQPVITISQARDLTDQDVQISWSNFTPSLGATYSEPNPGHDPNPFYPVAVTECNGTNPDWNEGYAYSPSDKTCYTQPVGQPITAANLGNPNAFVAYTQDTSAPANTVQVGSEGVSPWSPQAPASEVDSDPRVSSAWRENPGGNPSTWIGQADFHIEAPTPKAKGGFYNCAPSTPCSLVIDPNWGGTPVGLSYTDTSGCGIHANDFFPNRGTLAGEFGQGYAQSYQLPLAAGVPQLSQASFACWVADRIVIPLSFVRTAQDCPNKTPEFYAEGSPMMQTQMLQWEAGWCTGSAPVTLSSVFDSESLARGDFLSPDRTASPVDMALVTLPPDAAAQQASHRKFTYAPLANSGVDIAYEVDDEASGSQINRMVLNPRLLAKLTTQSYTLQYGACATASAQQGVSCDPAVQGNPYSLFSDPEFLSLNQDCEPFGQPSHYACGDHAAKGADPAYGDFPASDNGSNAMNIGGFLPTVLVADSDMTYDLTGWIASNSDAASFLAGKDDPWNMHVNNNYLGAVSYPAPVFNVLDNGYTIPLTSKNFSCTPQNSCAAIGERDESMQTSWNFQTDLDTIALDLLTDQPTAVGPVISCGLPGGSGCFSISELQPTTATKPEFIGTRVLLSEMDLGDIASYDFPAAALVSAAGKAVAPTQASVETAVRDMKTNPDGVTQYFDYSDPDPKAYPLAMVDYAMVPTCGLAPAQASAISRFLTKAATTGQVQGEAPGQLAPGYYPLNAKQKAQTLEAAKEVKAQDCKTKPPDHKVGGKKPPPTTVPPGKKTTGGQPGGTHSPTPSPTSTRGTSVKQPGTSGKNTQSPAPGTPSGGATAQVAAFGQKSPDSGMAGLLLLLAIVAGAFLLIGAPVAWVLTATGRWPVVLRWLRPVQQRLRAALVRLGVA